MRLLVFVMGLHMNDVLGNGIRVLVVDDDEDVRQVISDRLEQVGFAVVQAYDALRALAEAPFRRRGDRLQYALSQRTRFPAAVPARLA